MNELKPGTPCFLVGLADFESLEGRVVQVVKPVATPDGECGQWFAVWAEWTHEVFQGRDVIVQRCNLRPIVPPPVTAPRDVASILCQ